jgi:hypothetical protein
MKGTPNNLGSQADSLYELRAKRLTLEREVKELKSQETQLQKEMIDALIGQSLTGARGNLATVSINPATVGSVVDWSAVEKFVFEKKMFYLLQKRISNLAYLELLERSGGVPGIEPIVVNKLSITRSKK